MKKISPRVKGIVCILFAAFGFSMMTVFIRLAGDAYGGKGLLPQHCGPGHGGRSAGGEAGAAEAGKRAAGRSSPAGRCSAPSGCC